MATGTAELLIPDGDGDDYVKMGTGELEMLANYGQPQLPQLSDRAVQMGYLRLAPGEHLDGYSPRPASADSPRALFGFRPLARGVGGVSLVGMKPEDNTEHETEERTRHTEGNDEADSVIWPPQPNEWNGTEPEPPVRPPAETAGLLDDYEPEAALAVEGAAKAIAIEAESRDELPDPRLEQIGSHYLG